MTPPGSKPRPHPLDRPSARIAALGVVLLVAATLAWIHRDDLFPPERAAVPADDPVSLCLAERARGIDQMLVEGTIDAGQAALFKRRAEAFCEDQAGRGAGPPPPPGN